MVFPYVVGPPVISAITLAFFASNGSSASSTISCPASILAGDLIVLLDNSLVTPAGSIPAAVTPAGWTQAVTQGDTLAGIASLRTSIVWKTAAGTEGGTVITGMAPNTASDKVMLVFRPTGGTTWTPSGAAANNSATTPSIGTITAGAAPGIMIAYGQNYSNATQSTMSPAGTYVTQSTARGMYIVYNSSPANNTPAVGGGAGGAISGVYFART